MDPREIGNLFAVGFHGTRFDAEIRDLLDELNPCAVIAFSRNIEDPIQIAQLNHDLQYHALKKQARGLLVGVDQEGGRVCRLREPFRVFPPALAMAGSTNPEESVLEFAVVTARELRLVGFNLDFVPVLDVVDRPGEISDSIIGDRSYGADPQTVGSLGAIVMETMRSHGMVSCCKHFPGHGGTLVDSHERLPVDQRQKEIIESRDLMPFSRAVDLKTDMIMTAHVLYPALDPDKPATLSSAIIEGLLRRSMGFDGVVVTDDLDMGAVARTHSVEESTLLAITAGVDIPLICNSPEKALSARDRLMEAVKAGELSDHRVRESLNRINRLKNGYAESVRPVDVRLAREYFHSTLRKA